MIRRTSVNWSMTSLVPAERSIAGGGNHVMLLCLLHPYLKHSDNFPAEEITTLLDREQADVPMYVEPHQKGEAG